MPIYEYACQACGGKIEKLQKISDAPLKDCPACGEPALVKKVSAAGFRLKGGGWYETDFKKDGRRNLAADSAADNKTKQENKNQDKGKTEAGKSGKQGTGGEKSSGKAAA